MINKSLKNDNLKIIQALKIKVYKVGYAKVAERLNVVRGTIYFHLDESRADKANLDWLAKINNAVEQINEEIRKKQKALLNKTTG